MRNISVFIAFAFLSVAASAQKFTGSVDGTGSYNFKQSHNENLNFILNYDAPKWFLHSQVDGGFGYNPSDAIKTSANWDNNMEDTPFTAVNVETKQTFQKRWNYGLSLKSGINFSPANQLRMSFSAKSRGNNDSPDMYNYAYSAKDSLCGRQLDKLSFNSMGWNYDVEFKHTFQDAGRYLVLRVVGDLIFDTDVKDRELFNVYGQYYSNQKHYRPPSSLNDLNFKYQVGYADFLLVDKDVMECPVRDIHNAKVIATYFEGEKVYSGE